MADNKDEHSKHTEPEPKNPEPTMPEAPRRPEPSRQIREGVERNDFE